MVFEVLLSLSIALQAHAQCRDISSEDQRAVMIGQEVCFQCPLQGSNIMWTFLDMSDLPTGAQAVANGTILLSNVTQMHLDPNFFHCQPDGGQLSDRYTLVLASPPSAPTNLSVSAITTTSFLLTWTNPFNGNSPLTTATIALNSSGELTSFQADTLTSHQFQGLVPNQQYQIEVVIRNTIGPSLPGSVATLTLPLAPAQPTSFTVTANSSTELQLSWMPPADDRRVTPITSWVVQYQTDGSPTITQAISDPATRQFSLTGLMKGTLYVVSIAGVNSAGVGNFTEELSQRTAFDSPSESRNLQFIVLNPESVIIRWEPSADNGGSPLLNYRVQQRSAGQASYVTTAIVPHPLLEHQLSLVSEISYMVRVLARNTNITSYGPPSNELNFTTPPLNFPPASGVPPLHSNLTDTSVTISFAPLVGVVTVYVVEYRLDRLTWASATREIINMIAPNANGRISTTITGLEPNSSYQFRFFSRNDVGDGAPSPALSVVTGPQITIRAPAASETTEGSNFVLECLFSSDSAPATNVTWLLDSQPVTQTNVQLDGNRLTIIDAMETNSGLYSCQHISTDDAVVVTDIQINITSSPQGPGTRVDNTPLIIGVVVAVVIATLLLLILVGFITVLVCKKYKRTSA